MTSPATFTVPEVAAILGLSRNAAYAQAARGEIAGVAVLRVGRRLLVPARPLLEQLGIPPSVGTADTFDGVINGN